MIKSPASILFDINGIATAVSASDQPTSGALGHVMAGFDETKSVRYASFIGDALKVDGLVNIASSDSFSSAIVGSRYNQLEISYDSTDPDNIDKITVTKSNGGDAINSGGQAVFSTSVATNGGIKAVTDATVSYRPHAEVYAAFTCIFTAGVADSYQRIGIYDSNNGFFIGYEGTSFGVTIRKAASDTTTARASFNLDTLTGASGSKYTRAGVPETLDPTKDNLYRIRYGWLGAAPIIFEVLSPDGGWVPFHIIRHPNTNAATTINDPDLPITLDAQKTAGATNITMSTACWAAGTTSDLDKVTATITDDTLAKLTRSVITGETTGGGGGYVNVKVNPSGALTVEIDDGGGSITVDGVITGSGDVGILRQAATRDLFITGSVGITQAHGVFSGTLPSTGMPAGFSDGTLMQAARVYDLNTSTGSANEEHVLGVSLRSSSVSGSQELGTISNPLITSPGPYGKTVFGEDRVSLPLTLADLINKYEITPTEYSTLTSSVGTPTILHVPDESAIRLTVDGTSGSFGRLRTNTFYRYQSGKGQNIKMTLYHGDTGESNQVRRWGYFDEGDGLFFQLSGSNLGVVERKSTTGSPTELFYSQSAWNVDPLNGTGPSGITLDITKSQIYEIRFQWLGVGLVDYYINGYRIHTIPHANLVSGPYMKTGQLPLSWEVENNLSSSAGSMTTVCSSVLSENGEPPPEFSFAAFNSTPVSVTTTEVPILSIRPKATYNGITNRIITLPKKSVVSTEGARISYRILYNATLTGASWASVASTSGTEFDVSASAFTGGETLFYGFLPNSNDAEGAELEKYFSILARKLRQNAFATGVDTLTIVARNEAAGSTSVRAALVFTEVR